MEINRKNQVCSEKVGGIYQILIPESAGCTGLVRTDWKSAFHQHKKVMSEAIKYRIQVQDRELISNKEVSQPYTQLLVVHNASPMNNRKRGCSID
jgi:hypothetical protein